MITYDVPRLLDLAEAMRGPDWRDDLQNALVAARYANWDQDQAFRYALKLMLKDGSSPHEMTTATRNPLHKDPAAEPSAEWQERKAALLARHPGSES